MKIITDSRSRIAITWYDDEAEAIERAAGLTEEFGERRIERANFGITQCGRDATLDRVLDGVQGYAVVTP